VAVGLGLETASSNLTGWILVLIGVAFCMAGSVYLAVAPMRGTITAGRADRSLWLIGPGFLAALLAPPLEWVYLPPLLARGEPLQWAGLLLAAGGLALGLWVRQARHAAGDSFRLQGIGPYRFLRFPGYTALGLMTLGVDIGYSSLIGLAAGAILLAPGAAYRIQVEEKAAEAQLGDAYRTNAKRTTRLIPGVW
jgi:protein-S-isoprenylcysteine O-methyltransferase Ste14